MVNVRMEPLVYIGGKSYVLRAADAPTDLCAEYTGITSSRLEEMEDRLRSDVVLESEGKDSAPGRVLVHTRRSDAVVGSWECIDTGGYVFVLFSALLL